MKYINSCLLVLALMSQVVGAEELGFLTDEEMQGALTERITQGVIESVDLATRSVLISGFTYDFGSAATGDPVEVKMYNSDGGAFELLQPGMKVEIAYSQFDDGRLAVRVQQLSNNAVLEES